MKYINDFMLMFLLVYLFNVFYVNKFKRDYNKLKKNDPIVIFVLRYDLSLKKLNYVYLINILGIINSFIIAFTATIITNIDSIVWSLIVCFVVLCVLVYSLYEIAGRYFKKLENKEKIIKVKKKRKNKKSEGEK